MKKGYLLFLTLLTGCRVGPVYHGPEVITPCAWHSEVTVTEAPEDLVWWKELNDPTLDLLLDYAAAQNLDLKIAALRVLQARTEVTAKKADLLPHVDGSANYDHVYYSKDALVNGLIGTTVPVGCQHVRRNVNFYEVGFDAIWEFDFFGATKHEIASARAHEEAIQDNLCHAWVTLSAEIAKNYIELRGLQRCLEIVKHTNAMQEEAVRLTEELFVKGFVNESDFNQLKAEWNAQQGEIPLLELNAARTIHRLSILLGYPPGDLFDCLSPISPLPDVPCAVAIGIPSDLLRRRPDIRRAERELAAATERVGSAVASLFPRFSLRAFVGDIGTRAGSIFSPASFTWLAGPQLLVPVFNSQLLLQDVEYNKLVTQETLYTYQKTVLEALEEAENAIASYDQGHKRLQYLQVAHELNQKSAAFAEELYQNGVTDQFARIKAEQALAVAEEAHVKAKVDSLLSYIALYKALGGSWDCRCD